MHHAGLSTRVVDRRAAVARAELVVACLPGLGRHDDRLRHARGLPGLAQAQTRIREEGDAAIVRELQELEELPTRRLVEEAQLGGLGPCRRIERELVRVLVGASRPRVPVLVRRHRQDAALQRLVVGQPVGRDARIAHRHVVQCEVVRVQDGARSRPSQVAQGLDHVASLPVVGQGHGGGVAEAYELLRPLLRHARVDLVHPQVRVVGVEQRAHGRRRAVDLDRQVAVLTVLAQKPSAGVEPTDVEPHASPLRVAGGEFVTRQVDDLHDVPLDLELGRRLEVVQRAGLAGVQAVDLIVRERAAELQSAVLIEPLHGVRHPDAATRHVVVRQVVAHRRGVLLGTLARRGPHVTGLAGEVPRVTVEVVAVGAGGHRRDPGLLDRPLLQLLRQPVVVVDERRRERAQAPFAVGALDGAVGPREVVEAGLAIH